MGIKTNWVDMALYTFKKTVENGSVWHLWGHSWEIEEYDLWDDLRKVFDAIPSKRSKLLD